MAFIRMLWCIVKKIILMKINLRIMALVGLALAGLILVYLIYDINRTEQSLAKSMLERPLKNIEDNLTNYFQRIESSLFATREQVSLDVFDHSNPKSMNSFFGPIIDNFQHVSSMAIADTRGYEFDISPSEQGFKNREVWVDQWGMIEKWSYWENDLEKGESVLIREWNNALMIDPRERPWFNGGSTTKANEVFWTEPYQYITTFEVGMSACLNWKDKETEKTNILCFDITLSDISDYTEQLQVSPHGKIFVLTTDGKYVGLPSDDQFKDEECRQNSILSSVDSIDIPSVQDAFNTWLEENKLSSSFEFESGNQDWWGKLMEYRLTKDTKLIIGTIVPELDILSELQRTKRIAIGAFLFILVLTSFLLYSYSLSEKANRLLGLKNIEIEKQKIEIEGKSKSLLDSIIYATRIQKAMFPPNQEVNKWLPNHFILYKPKDTISGDFYWMETFGNMVYYAAADCTGHGVPGAVVSVLCMTALNRSVREFGLRTPGKILDKTRELLIKKFERSEDNVKDGMDISLCALNTKTNKLLWSGANNPLWIIRHGASNIEEIKADKQPIGNYELTKPFTTHKVTLYSGDTIYTFSDGYADQFGGEMSKKFKVNALRDLLLSVQDQSMEKQHSMIDEAFEAWKGKHEQVDDVCVIGVRV